MSMECVDIVRTNAYNKGGGEKEMSKTANIHMRVDPIIKAQAEEVFKKLGTSTTDAITMFLYMVVNYQGIPFEIALNVPNAETLEAFKEAEELRKDPNSKSYLSFAELLEEMQNETDD